ncbi:MAG: hypothetical protein IPN13_12115 [Bacteroidetes bacterium]|nr:hypothetical protein [Bacteroidota bacterium]
MLVVPLPLQVTKMGGNNTDGAKSITIDTFDNVIVTGSYKSMGFYPLGLNKPPYSGANCFIPAQIGRPINYIMK